MSKTVKWPLGAKHPIYGTVAMCGVTGGEPYRWFVKGNSVAMLPLDAIPDPQEIEGEVEP